MWFLYSKLRVTYTVHATNLPFELPVGPGLEMLVCQSLQYQSHRIILPLTLCTWKWLALITYVHFACKELKSSCLPPWKVTTTMTLKPHISHEEKFQCFNIPTKQPGYKDILIYKKKQLNTNNLSPCTTLLMHSPASLLRYETRGHFSPSPWPGCSMPYWRQSEYC